MRVLEWDDSRAKYPNIWHDGLPIRLLAFDSVGQRLRLGDLIAVYYPASQKHAQRAEHFLGIVRVDGLSRSHSSRYVWVDVAAVHRFDPPLDLGEAPRRVFLCCDPEWPDREVELFRKLFDAAVAAGWEPSPDETEEGASAGGEKRGDAEASAASRKDSVAAKTSLKTATARSAPHSDPTPGDGERLFAGVDFSGDMRDPRDRTWLALLGLQEDHLRVVRLDPTGRSGLQACLRDADPVLQRAEAVGMDFAFGLPLSFASSLLGGEFPDEGWWALAKRLEKMSRPEFLGAVQDFLQESGELHRHTDEKTGAHSPLHRGKEDTGAMCYHGIRIIAEERSRYAVRPFETAKGRLMLEVYPAGLARALGGSGRPSSTKLLDALSGLDHLPVQMDDAYRSRCLSSRDALDAVLAARCAAEAVISGEADRDPEELAPGNGALLRREGWIYGTGGGSSPSDTQTHGG